MPFDLAAYCTRVGVDPVRPDAAGLAALGEGGGYDLVFSDIVMAGEIDGLGMARRIRDIFPDCPVLLATGYSEAAERIGDEFPILRKPYRLPDLNRAIGALLAAHASPRVVSIEAARRSRAPRNR